MKLDKRWILNYNGFHIEKDGTTTQKLIHIFNKPFGIIPNTAHYLTLGTELYVSSKNILNDIKIFFWEPLSNSKVYFEDLESLNFMRRILVKILKDVDRLKKDYSKSSFEVFHKYINENKNDEIFENHEFYENEGKKTISINIKTNPRISIYFDIDKKEKYGMLKSSFGIFNKIKISKKLSIYKFAFLNRKMIIWSLQGLFSILKFSETYKGKILEESVEKLITVPKIEEKPFKEDWEFMDIRMNSVDQETEDETVYLDFH